MHSDLEALAVVCTHYRKEYSSDEIRRAKNKIQRLTRDIIRLTIELYYVKALLRVWMEHTRTIWNTLTDN